MIHRSLKLIAAALICATSAHAQLATSLKTPQKPAPRRRTRHRHRHRHQSRGPGTGFPQRRPLPVARFHRENHQRQPRSIPEGRAIFGPMKIGAGQTLAREVDLSQHFQLSRAGKLLGLRRDSSAGRNHGRDSPPTGCSSTRVPDASIGPRKSAFPEVPATPGSIRVLNFSGDSKSQIYAQIVDGQTGQLVRTFLLGDVLMLRKPLATVDRQQRMHVMFLATPIMWVHYVVNTDGKVVNRQIHQRGPSEIRSCSPSATAPSEWPTAFPTIRKPPPSNGPKSARSPTGHRSPIDSGIRLKFPPSGELSLHFLKNIKISLQFYFPYFPMKTILRLLALAATCAFGTTASAANFRTVVIDPGHGGQDNGGQWGRGV